MHLCRPNRIARPRGGSICTQGLGRSVAAEPIVEWHVPCSQRVNQRDGKCHCVQLTSRRAANRQ